MAALTLEQGLLDARADLLSLERLGISMEQVTAELEKEGVEAFAKAFADLLAAIEKRSAAFRLELNGIASVTAKQIENLDKQKTTGRIWQHDPTVWVKDAAGMKVIRERLGWLDTPRNGLELVAGLEKFRDACLKDGFTHALLLGMGGSSLAPEVMRDIFTGAVDSKKALKFSILDSTDPGQVLAAEKWAPAGKTLYIVSSKSGGTAEVDAMFRYFWARVEKEPGRQTGKAFVAITDSGTSLETLGKERRFRRSIPGR